ncbi:MAG: MMPL family transporter, partial [Clostridiaceae bacterium]|nr:MMPL family transporter [Clostridiaceae bacterium]
SILPESITSRLHADNYSRILVYIRTADESETAFKCSDEIKAIVKKYDPENSYLIGATPCTKDIKTTITADYEFVDKLSLLGVVLVILLSFKSLLLALLAIIPIKIAIFINMAFPYLTGDKMVYIGYIIVSCIQLGATVDYGILMLNNYLDRRKHMEKKEAAIKAISDSTAPVLTSGLILSCAGFILGKTSSISAIAGMGQLIGRGAILAVILSLCMLPTLLLIFDKLIMKNINKANTRREERLKKIYYRRERLKNQNRNIA